MNIVQINCSVSGSTGNIAKAIHRKLINDGHNSYIFYGLGNTNEKNMFRVGNYFDLHFHSVMSRNLGKQGYFSHIPTYRLIKKLKKINPDIIHLHNLHGSYLNLPMLFRYLKKSGVKVLITLHDCWLFTGKCPHFTVAGCEKWKMACGNCPQLDIYPKSKVDTTAKCLTDKKNWLSGFGDNLQIVAVSNWLKDTAKQSFLSQYQIDTIYNGVNYDIFRPMDSMNVRKKYNLGDNFVILGVASNWNDQKGLNEFLELSKKLSDNELIVLVGLTESQISSMPDNIVGIARTENQTELAELYSAANVFVNTSKEETFGLVTAEAMACGTPVIVYDSTACAEIVSEEYGFVIRNNKSDEILENIRKCVKMDKVSPCTAYSVEIMVDSYLDFYRRFYGENSHNFR